MCLRCGFPFDRDISECLQRLNPVLIFVEHLLPISVGNALVNRPKGPPSVGSHERDGKYRGLPLSVELNSQEPLPGSLKYETPITKDPRLA